MNNLYTRNQLAKAADITVNTLIKWELQGHIEPLYTAGGWATGGKEIRLYDLHSFLKSPKYIEYKKHVHKSPKKTLA